MPANAHLWRIRRRDVQIALASSRDSAPGPDGIAASLWKRLGEMAVTVLFEAAQALAAPSAPGDIQAAYADEDGSSGNHGFNLGILCCIPKKASEHDPDLGAVHTADGTRPLSLVDVSNRINAGAYKHRWECTLGSWVSPGQRGFLPGRSMLANVVELEHAAMMTAMREAQGMIVLVDFKAAFPSVSHRFMRLCLDGLGMPSEALRVLDAFYARARCSISVGGGRWPGFDMQSGIRQGCPLSPLIFATVMDLLLRILPLRIEGVVVRAFADDIGIVLQDAPKQLPILQQALHEFGLLSGMEVNLPKTVGIPLWEEPLSDASARVAAACPAWRQLPLRRSATYLGCVIGPEKTSSIWDTACQRFQERVAGWSWSAMGLHFAILAYNVYALPVLAFTAQIAAPDERVLDLEEWALRRAAPGPGNWATLNDLWCIGVHYGMPHSFGRLEDVARASHLRIAHRENAEHGGLLLRQRARELLEAVLDSEYEQRRAQWSAWLKAAIPAVLTKSLDDLAAMGVTAEAVEERADRASRRFQAVARERIAQAEARSPHFRIRHKLSRWQLPGVPRQLADAFQTSLGRLRRLVPPRVVAAVFSTAWNRWCTFRRFHQRGDAGNFCRLGCGGGAEDSIEHYSRCRVMRHFHATSLRIDAESLLPHWSGVHAGRQDDELLAKGALGAYAAYRATNSTRATGAVTAAAAGRALQQALREAAIGHRTSERCLARIWA